MPMRNCQFSQNKPDNVACRTAHTVAFMAGSPPWKREGVWGGGRVVPSLARGWATASERASGHAHPHRDDAMVLHPPASGDGQEPTGDRHSHRCAAARRRAGSGVTPCPWHLSVYLAPVADPQHEDAHHVILDNSNDPPVAHPVPPEAPEPLAFQCFAEAARIVEPRQPLAQERGIRRATGMSSCASSLAASSAGLNPPGQGRVPPRPGSTYRRGQRGYRVRARHSTVRNSSRSARSSTMASCRSGFLAAPGRLGQGIEPLLDLVGELKMQSISAS